MPGTYDLKLYRGDTWGATVKLWADEAMTTPISLVGATVAAEIRDRPAGPKVVTMEATIDPAAPHNAIVLGIPASIEWSLVQASGVWDLEVTYPSGAVKTELAGKVEVTADVTHSTGDAPVVARGAP